MANIPQQLLLDMPLRTALGREDFFVSPANEQAVAAVDQWPDWPNPVMVLTGPKSSGKTHLAQVWRQISRARQISVAALTVEDVPSFLTDKALLVEDLPGENLNETALFHLINLAREQSGWLLLTAQRPAANWHIRLPDLASRLAAAGSAAIDAPDDALLRAILIKQFADRQISVDEAIINFMVARMERSAEAARQLVAEIDHEALRQKANVTRPFVSSIMNRQFNLPEM